MKKILMILVVAILATSCKKEQGIVLSETDVTMHYDEEKQLEVSFLDEAMDYSFSSSNENIAFVSEDGLISGVSIGSVTITVKSKDGQYSDECKVVIKPYYAFLYSDLCCEFGAYKQKVKEFEKRELAIEEDQSLSYYGDMEYVLMVGYSFEDYKLESSAIIIDTYMGEILSDYLFERYKYIGYEDGVIVFMSYDKKMIIGFTILDSYEYIVMFIECPENFKSNNLKQIFANIETSLKSQTKINDNW